MKRQRVMQAVVSAKLDRLSENRPMNEIWSCKLACGHECWTSTNNGTRSRPRLLKCEKCTDATPKPEGGR